MKEWFERHTREDRCFFDGLIRLIWCEIRLPIGHAARSVGDEWADCEMCSYKKGWTTPRQELSKKMIRELTDWMGAHSAMYDIMRGRDMMKELFNDCQLTALNCTASMLEWMNTR